MIPTIKAGLLATTMAAVALIPVAGIVTLASVDAAYAKGGGNGNGNGNGNGGNGGGGERGNGNGGKASEARGGGTEARGGGRPEWAGSRADGGNRSGGRSETARRGSDPISNFIRGLTGEEKREVRAQPRAETRAAPKAPTEHAPQASISPAKRPARNSDLHPSALGNMNGALNANINAVLAHVRNGNFEGPIGGLAALAVADAAFASSDADQILKEEAVAELLGEYETIKAYQDAVEEGVDPIPELDTAIAALGEDVNLEGLVDSWRPDSGEVIAAEEALQAKLQAEAMLLSEWNKNPDTDPNVMSEEELTLLNDLRTRLGGHENDIEQAIAQVEAQAASGVPEEDEEAACEGLAGCEASEAAEEDLTAAN